MPSAGTGQTAPTAAEPASSFNDPSALLVGQQGNSVISQMEAMGFERPQIERAMRAAFFNPDRAIEYLLNGIPESVQAEQRQGGGARGAAAATSPPPAPATAAAPTSPPAVDADADEPVNLFEAAAQAGQGQGGARGGAAARSGAGAAAGGAPTGAVNIDFLRNSPHFQHLRQLVQQQPAMLEPILQQVAEGNPQLAQMIGQNQDQFLQLLSEVCSTCDKQPQKTPHSNCMLQDLGGDAIGGMGDTGPMPPGAVPISVTEEERDAIERLCRLGFSRDAVVQAYFAFDKNEELAANWLFEQPEDDDQQ
jgi:UV excision repair protein RAD23